MSSFTTPLLVEILRKQRRGRTLARIVEPFTYYDDTVTPGTRVEITVPIGFITDFASIPRFLWVLIPPLGAYAKAAVVHDYLTKSRNAMGFYAAATVFFDAMIVLRVPRWQAWIMAKSVAIFGPRW